MTGYEYAYVNGVRSVGVDGYRLRHPEVTVDPDNWAHGVWTALAITLAEPLRQALGAHLETCPARSMDRCPECMRLFELLPDGDKVLIA